MLSSCLYWLVKHKISHTSNYGKRLHHLHVDENAKYTSQRMIQEFLSVLGEQIEHGQLEGFCNSQFFALMIDESTDIAILKKMVIYAQYVTPKAEICTFLKILPLKDGTSGNN